MVTVGLSPVGSPPVGFPPVAGISSVLVALHVVQVEVFTPFSVAVGCFVIMPASQLCPRAGITVPVDTNTSQSAQ